MKKLMLFFLQTFFFCVAMEQKDTWDADLYDAHSNPQYEASLKNLEEFDLSLPQFKTIVELGCNTANISNNLALRYPEKAIVGIDPEQAAIDLATKKHKDRKNLLLMCSSAQKYTLQDHKVPLADFIACYHVLHWVAREDQQDVFNNIAANLAENGILDISTSAKQEDTSLTKAVLRTILRPKWWGYLPSCINQVRKGQNVLTVFTVSELKQIATQAGLVVNRCEETNQCARFNSKDEFRPWLHSILKPHGIEATFAERQIELVNDAVDLYCKEYNPATGGAIEYRFNELHLTAVKPAHIYTEFSKVLNNHNRQEVEQ